MNTRNVLLTAILAASAAGCARIDYVPPASVPNAGSAVSETFPPAPGASAQSWRPYSSGPLQASSPGLRLSERRADAPVERKALPAPSERANSSPVPTEGGKGNQGTSNPPQDTDDSGFGSGVSSEWGKGYVPASLRDEFGIFARKAAVDEQARMVTPTGEVYAAMVTRRNGPCSTVEVTVTEGGDLPVLSRGLVEVCRAK